MDGSSPKRSCPVSSFKSELTLISRSIKYDIHNHEDRKRIKEMNNYLIDRDGRLCSTSAHAQVDVVLPLLQFVYHRCAVNVNMVTIYAPDRHK